MKTTLFTYDVFKWVLLAVLAVSLAGVIFYLVLHPEDTIFYSDSTYHMSQW